MKKRLWVLLLILFLSMQIASVCSAKNPPTEKPAVSIGTSSNVSKSLYNTILDTADIRGLGDEIIQGAGVPNYFIYSTRGFDRYTSLAGGTSYDLLSKAFEEHFAPMGIRAFWASIDDFTRESAALRNWLTVCKNYGGLMFINLPGWGYLGWGKEITAAHPDAMSHDNLGNPQPDLPPVIDFFEYIVPYFQEKLRTAYALYGAHPSIVGIIGAHPFTDHPIYGGSGGKLPSKVDVIYGFNLKTMERFTAHEYYRREVDVNGFHTDGTKCKLWEHYVEKTVTYSIADLATDIDGYHDARNDYEPPHGYVAYLNVKNAELCRVLHEYAEGLFGRKLLHVALTRAAGICKDSGLTSLPLFTTASGAPWWDNAIPVLQAYLYDRFNIPATSNMGEPSYNPYRLPTEDEILNVYLRVIPLLADFQLVNAFHWNVDTIQDMNFTASMRKFGTQLGNLRYYGGWYGRERTDAVNVLAIGAQKVGLAPQFLTPVFNITQISESERWTWEAFPELTSFKTIIVWDSKRPDISTAPTDVQNKIKSFVAGGGGLIVIKGWSSAFDEIFAAKTKITDPNHPIFKPYGTVLLEAYEAKYGAGKAVQLIIPHSYLESINTNDSVIIPITNTLLYTSGRRDLIPAWWHTEYKSISQGYQAWTPQLYYSICGKPNTPKLLWLSNRDNSASNFEIHLNAAFYNIDQKGWIAIDAQNWQVVAKGSGNDIKINTTIPAKSWKQIYITNTTTGPTHTLSVTSSPIIGVSFTLDGIGHTTPYSTNLNEGTHTVVMPSTITSGGTTYNFVKWEDGSSNPTRTVNLTTDMTLTAYYQAYSSPHTLNINSSPISGVTFTINSTIASTPYSASLNEGRYIIIMPSSAKISGVTYNFVKWEDNSTNSTRTVNLTTDMALTAYYGKVVVTHTLTVSSSPIVGVSFTINGTAHTTPWTGSLEERTCNVAMPFSITINGTTYNFKRWEEGSTSPIRTISLNADMTITAYYEAISKTHILSVSSSPITGISFTIDEAPHTTPWSGSLTEGSYNVAMPSSVVVAGTTYIFKNWEDGFTSLTRTINLLSDINITAYYEKLIITHALTVLSSPITKVNFTINKETQTTPYSVILPETSYEITMSSTWTVADQTYKFQQWDDGSTNLTRTINLVSNITITVYYEVAPSPPPLPPPPSPPPPANDALNLTNPSIGMQGCLAAKQAYIFQVNVSDSDGVANLNYVDLILDPAGQAIKVRWTESTNAWSEENDPSNYIYLGECWKSISGDRVTLNFAIVFRWTYPDESLHSVRLYSLNDDDLSDTDDFTDVYYVENDLAIQTPSVSDGRVDPGQAIIISGYIYYEGTSIHPPDGDYQVQVKLSGIQKGLSNTTLVSGHYSIDITAESMVGNYVYYVSCHYNTSTVNTPPIIVDKLTVLIDADAYEVDVGARVNFTVTITRQYDSTNVTSFFVTIARNGTPWLTLADKNFSDVLSTTGHCTYSTGSVTDNTYTLTSFKTNDLTILWRQRFVGMAVQVKDSAKNTAIQGASVYIQNDTWKSEIRYADVNGWANFTQIETGTYTIVGETKGYATALDTVSVTTDITYTLLLSKRALPLAATPIIISPDFAIILIAASAFSTLGHFMFQRRSKR